MAKADYGTFGKASASLRSRARSTPRKSRQPLSRAGRGRGLRPVVEGAGGVRLGLERRHERGPCPEAPEHAAGHRYLEGTHKTLDWWSAELQSRRHNWGTLYLPHDGAHGDFKTGKSAKQIMEEHGWTVEIVPVQPVETGIVPLARSANATSTRPRPRGWWNA